MTHEDKIYKIRQEKPKNPNHDITTCPPVLLKIPRFVARKMATYGFGTILCCLQSQCLILPTVLDKLLRLGLCMSGVNMEQEIDRWIATGLLR